MKLLSFDTETDLFGPGNMDPRPVCMSWTWDGEVGHLCTEDEIEAHLSEWLSDRDIRFLGQNVAYDFGCLYRWYPALRALIWSAYDRFAVVDTQIHERLIHIQAGTDGKESLAHLAKQYLDVDLDKTTHRLSYGSLRGRPISAWPDGAARYAIDDALMTRRVWECQRREGSAPKRSPARPVMPGRSTTCRSPGSARIARRWTRPRPGSRSSRTRMS